MAITQISAREADERVRDGRALLLDVREDHELATASVAAAQHVPMAEVPARIDEIRASREGRELIVMCRSGGRSQRVAEFLNQQGFDGVFNLEGGIDAWSREVDPSIPRY